MEQFTLHYGILFSLFIAINSELSPGQLNVCQKTESYRVNVTESYKSSVRVKVLTWCLGIPPRCTEYRTEYRTSYRQVERLSSRVKYECCPGYVQKGDDCLPDCPLGCVHGACVAPGLCDCEAGWRGGSCDSRCRDGTWGENCAHPCRCIGNHGVCDVQTGQCHCNSGFHGTRCEFLCPQGTFGPHCSQQCKCVASQSKCDAVSGRCQCDEGYHGALCDKLCPEAVSGQSCPNDCPCQNGGQCYDDRTCDCPPGWAGPVCAVKCPPGTFGYNCERRCVCYNGGSCDHVTGECSCPAGYTGSKCEISCPMGKFGLNCQHNCTCENEAYCSHIDGNCTCTREWMGPNCNLRVCPLGFWGPSCSSRCKCILDNSECDSWSGQCTCKPGFRGPRCGLRCAEGYFGLGCVQKCYCTDSEQCDHIDGCIPISESGSIHEVNDEVDDLPLPWIAILCIVFFIVILFIVLCLAIYYRRRYKRLKHTTELVVEYTRADMGDPEVVAGATGGAESDSDVMARSEKSKMLEASSGGNYSAVDCNSHTDDEDSGAARRPIYTASRSARNRSPQAPPRSGRNKRHARGTREGDARRESQEDPHRDHVYPGLPEEPPPPYTPTPQLHSPPPPYSVDTPAENNNGSSERTRARAEPLGAQGGSPPTKSKTRPAKDRRDRTVMRSDSCEEDINSPMYCDSDLQNQNTENESREASLPPM